VQLIPESVGKEQVKPETKQVKLEIDGKEQASISNYKNDIKSSFSDMHRDIATQI
jgi:hypothetical protein